MGGECYDFMTLNPELLPDQEDRDLYASTVLPKLTHAAATFMAHQNDERLSMQSNTSSAIRISYAYKGLECSADIVCPRTLDNTLHIGWQHHGGGRVYDGKAAIAKYLISVFLGSRMNSPYFLLRKTANSLLADLEFSRPVEAYERRVLFPDIPVKFYCPINSKEKSTYGTDLSAYNACPNNDCSFCSWYRSKNAFAFTIQDTLANAQPAGD